MNKIDHHPWICPLSILSSIHRLTNLRQVGRYDTIVSLELTFHLGRRYCWRNARSTIVPAIIKHKFIPRRQIDVERSFQSFGESSPPLHYKYRTNSACSYCGLHARGKAVTPSDIELFSLSNIGGRWISTAHGISYFSASMSSLEFLEREQRRNCLYGIFFGPSTAIRRYSNRMNIAYASRKSFSIWFRGRTANPLNGKMQEMQGCFFGFMDQKFWCVVPSDGANYYSEINHGAPSPEPVRSNR